MKHREAREKGVRSRIGFILNGGPSRDHNRSDNRRVIFLQFSDNDHSSPLQIAALIGQNRRTADIVLLGDPVSLAAAWRRFRSEAELSHR
jgi:hypothetical protein